VRRPANTGVVLWAGKVLALYERDLPYVMDTSLRTLATSTLGVWKGTRRTLFALCALEATPTAADAVRCCSCCVLTPLAVTVASRAHTVATCGMHCIIP
jgi:hypothetical protein